MNREQYNSDPRYAKVLEQMDLLGIMDVSTTRQSKNGTITWRLPIKNQYKNGKLIEVASFKTGYVRNNNSGYSNYQLNKRCENEPEYYPEHKWVKDSDGEWSHQIKTGKYLKFTTRGCVLIPIEIDRLEYLISYCLKNYYIKHANFVASGNYVPKWKHEWELEQLRKRKEEIRGHFLNKENDCGHYERIRDLENKLDTIQRVADYK
jgi:hypothetical protein